MSKKTRIYKECFNYLRKLKNYFYIIIIIFLFAMFLGYFFPYPLEDELRKIIEKLIEETKGMNIFELAIFIISNNITTSFIALIFGILIGIVPIIMNFFNGYFLGFVLSKSIDVFGYQVIMRLFPHGIFELPAFFISIALGLKLGMFIFTKNKKSYLAENLEKSLKIFIYIIIPLLIIAGIIETILIFFIK